MRNLVSIILLFSLYLGACARGRARITPPKDVDTFAEFVAKMPPPRQLGLARFHGADHLVWMGESLSMLELPSGSSCHVFDQNGDLVASFLETGEGGEIERAVMESYGRQKDIADIQSWIHP